MGSTSRSKFLVFGPQSLSFDCQIADRLHSQLSGDSRLYWIRDTLQDLSSIWQPLADGIPIITQLDGEKHLRGLSGWLETGESKCLKWPLPNMVLTPLTVVLHLVEHQHRKKSKRQTQDSDLGGSSEVIGLCTGLLTSSAFSFSSDEEQFKMNASAAIRLATLVGAVVDAEDLSRSETERAVSISVHWNPQDVSDTVEEVLEVVPTVSNSTN